MDDKGRGRSFYRRPRQPLDKDRLPQTEQDRTADAPAADGAHRHADRPGEGERIVVPREERGDSRSGVDVELREVRWGATSRGAYLRVIPSRQRFKKTAPGHITATAVGSKPVSGIERFMQAVKRVLLGNPFATSQMIHERLDRVKALAIFSSDALSSSAYATEEILIVLVLAGAAALSYSIPIAITIALLIGIVTLSYRQTIQAYPGGGGAYIVSIENLGRTAGLVAGAALLVDYVLTVSVSTSAGVAAVTSAIPDLHDYRVPIGTLVIVVITLGNLRGIREAGTLFAIPTYFFIFSMATVLVIGFAKVAMGDTPDPEEIDQHREELDEGAQVLTLFLVFRAFSSGCAALTGIEAISNGVPAFKTPEVKNAQATMAYMAVILGVLFLGITFLTHEFGFVPSHALEGEEETIVSKLGRTVLGENVLYYGYQVATAMVLFLAANTSYSAFPPLGANLARDHFLPRHFSFRGDRLAYSNGILILAAAAIGLVIAFQADVNRLIPLYALGVFISFTLSQAGMVLHLRKEQATNLSWAIVLSAVGATATAVVALIIGGSKFTAGAWISIVMMAVIMAMFALIRRHYDWYGAITAVDDDEMARRAQRAAPITSGRERIIIPVDDVNKITMGAIDMGRAISSNITAVHLTDDLEQAEIFRDRWERAVPDVPILVIESPYRAFAAPMLAYIEQLERIEGSDKITVILPSFKAKHWWESLLHNRAIQRLRPFLEDDEGVQVVDFEYDVDRNQPLSS